MKMQTWNLNSVEEGGGAACEDDENRTGIDRRLWRVLVLVLVLRMDEKGVEEEMNVFYCGGGVVGKSVERQTVACPKK